MALEGQRGGRAISRPASACGCRPGAATSRRSSTASPTASSRDTKSSMAALRSPVQSITRSFEDTCLDMIHTYGVNQFKFDGTGNVDRSSRAAGSTAISAADPSDRRAARSQARHLHQPDTGTWPSPFWLMLCRLHLARRRGPQLRRRRHLRASAGSPIATRRPISNIVKGGPLFPAQFADAARHDLCAIRRRIEEAIQGDFRDEVQSYFGTGTQMQEMYITPSLLSSADWDALAKARAGPSTTQRL